MRNLIQQAIKDAELEDLLIVPVILLIIFAVYLWGAIVR